MTVVALIAFGIDLQIMLRVDSFLTIISLRCCKSFSQAARVGRLLLCDSSMSNLSAKEGIALLGFTTLLALYRLLSTLHWLLPAQKLASPYTTQRPSLFW